VTEGCPFDIPFDSFGQSATVVQPVSIQARDRAENWDVLFGIGPPLFGSGDALTFSQIGQTRRGVGISFVIRPDQVLPRFARVWHV